ncbi:hypothetical protein [Peribacillus alkalitolerans]|uniref:hypothetical protein n=1 Tax=Peribacillus alkalitolerans TaxID=1550385 RepID=UPI0013D6FF76|nr:hypothetical protein [Peribacillus alkalitolerans]
MKKIMGVLMTILIFIFLSSCSSNSSQMKKENIQIIDENLKLKDKIIELEERIKELEDENNLSKNG